ncbi:hypothetical protein D3C83_54080 [compost metagenome]
MVRVPRAWDSPERRAAEAYPRRELSRLARTFQTSLSDWTESICALATWIRYSPLPVGTKPDEPWIDDETEEDADGGPETTH